MWSKKTVAFIIGIVVFLFIFNAYLCIKSFVENKDSIRIRHNNAPKYEISLDRNYQNYIYDKCEENQLSYEMVLGMVYADDYSWGGKPFIINNEITECIIKELEIENYDEDNIYQNIDIGIYYIDELRDYFGQDMADEYVFTEVISAYKNNIEYVEMYGSGSYSEKYVSDVEEIKMQLETTGKIKEDN